MNTHAGKTQLLVKLACLATVTCSDRGRRVAVKQHKGAGRQCKQAVFTAGNLLDCWIHQPDMCECLLLHALASISLHAG
jgi:hypothetical protein